jgi:hypothetical protein
MDASYQVSVHLAEMFQKRLKCEKLTDDRCQVMAKAHIYYLPKVNNIDTVERGEKKSQTLKGARVLNR